MVCTPILSLSKTCSLTVLAPRNTDGSPVLFRPRTSFSSIKSINFGTCNILWLELSLSSMYWATSIGVIEL